MLLLLFVLHLVKNNYRLFNKHNSYFFVRFLPDWLPNSSPSFHFICPSIRNGLTEFRHTHFLFSPRVQSIYFNCSLLPSYFLVTFPLSTQQGAYEWCYCFVIHTLSLLLVYSISVSCSHLRVYFTPLRLACSKRHIKILITFSYALLFIIIIIIFAFACLFMTLLLFYLFFVPGPSQGNAEQK